MGPILPGPVPPLDARVENLEDGSPLPGRPGKGRQDLEAHALPFNQDGLATLGAVQHFRHPHPGLCHGVALHLYIVQPRLPEDSENKITPTPEVVPFMTCSFAPSAPWTAGQQLLCQSVVSRSELVNIIQIGDYEPKKLPIKISSAGALVSEQTFEPVFTTREINGPAAERAGSRRSR